MAATFPVYSIGHFINQPTSRTEFDITHFGDMAEPDVDDPHKHTFYEILWVDAGTSRQAIDYREYELTPRSLFFISPGQLHFFEEWAHLTGGSVLFTADFFLLNNAHQDKFFALSFLDNVYANPLLTPSRDDYDEIRHTIDLLSREKSRLNSSDAICQSLLHVLLGQIQRCIETQTGQVASRKYVILYKRLKNLLDQHFSENWSVGEYADQLNVTPHHLNIVCKQVAGATAGEVIRARSMLEAKRLLTFTGLGVVEVASQLGFLDSSYFARTFRRETGQSPVAFQRVMSQKYPR